MIELVRRRHSGPGWIVVGEVGNSTGGNQSRRADAIAMGIWPSRGFELHGFEFKASRQDLRKELEDVTKADAVGKFCDYWWLVVEDKKILDGEVVPATWGILYPKSGILRVHRKAPKRKDVTPVHRGFMASLIRNVVDDWVPKDEHEAFKKNATEEVKKQLQRDRQWQHDSAEVELKRMREKLDQFKETTGVDIMEGGYWGLGKIGAAVKHVMNVMEASGGAMRRSTDWYTMAISDLEQEIMRAKGAIGGITNSISQLRYLQKQAAEKDRQTPPVTGGGDRDADTQTPAPSDDDEGGGVDRGGAGADEQDAGPQLRDHGEQVHHGQSAS